MIDASLQNEGSIVLVRLHTEAARQWVNENVGGEPQFFGGALVVEPRYLSELVDGMVSDGLNLFN